VIYAGTDRNDDGVICEDGDLCGALPSLSQPQIVTLTPGQQLGNINFSVAQRVLQQVTSENAYRFPKLRRLR